MVLTVGNILTRIHKRRFARSKQGKINLTRKEIKNNHKFNLIHFINVPTYICMSLLKLLYPMKNKNKNQERTILITNASNATLQHCDPNYGGIFRCFCVVRLPSKHDKRE